jgi:predicted transcriptional regulator
MNRKLTRAQAARVKSMLVARDITQQSIADHLGISGAAVSGAINGHHASAPVTEYVAKLLKADYQKLFGKAA